MSRSSDSVLKSSYIVFVPVRTIWPASIVGLRDAIKFEGGGAGRSCSVNKRNMYRVQLGSSKTRDGDGYNGIDLASDKSLLSRL